MPSNTPPAVGTEGAPGAPGAAGVPSLRRGVRLVYDEVRGQYALLYPEGVRLLNDTAAAILLRCDGSASIVAIARELTMAYDQTAEATSPSMTADIERFVTGLAAKHLLEVDVEGKTEAETEVDRR